MRSLEDQIRECKSPTEIAETLRRFQLDHGVTPYDHRFVDAPPSDSHPATPLTFSRIVHLPSGARVMIENARSESELDFAESEIRKVRR
jgi:hypothetical protein